MNELKNTSYYTLAEESYSILMTVLENSFIDNNIPEQTIEVTRKSLFQLDIFLSHLIDKKNKINEDKTQQSCDYISKCHDKFQGFIESMSYDLSNDISVFSEDTVVNSSSESKFVKSVIFKKN